MRVALLGRSDVLFEVANALQASAHEITSIVTAREAPEYKWTSSDFADLASQLNVPFGTGVTALDYVEILRRGEPEIVVSANFPVLVPQGVIDSFPHGILNIHGGDLPRYRGNACQAWAILRGESRIGLSIHKMEGAQLDSGPIIAKAFLSIDQDTSITEVHSWLLATAPQLLLESLARLEDNPDYCLEDQYKSTFTPLRCFPRRPEDGRIRWAQSSLEVHRLVKASARPYRGAFSYSGDVEVTIWDSQITNWKEDFLAIPGQVMDISENSITVACGEGALRVVEWQVSGESTLNTPFLRSIRDRLSL